MKPLQYLPFLLPLFLPHPTTAIHCTTCPNRLPALGPPDLVPRIPRHTPTEVSNNPYSGRLEYPLWVNSPCDIDNPHQAVEHHLWQEIGFQQVNRCEGFERWKPYKSSGYTFRVGDFSIVPGEDEAPCRLMLFAMEGCQGEAVHLDVRINTTVIDTESRCWSHDTQVIAKSAIMHCGWLSVKEDSKGSG